MREEFQGAGPIPLLTLAAVTMEFSQNACLPLSLCFAFLHDL